MSKCFIYLFKYFSLGTCTFQALTLGQSTIGANATPFVTKDTCEKACLDDNTCKAYQIVAAKPNPNEFCFLQRTSEVTFYNNPGVQEFRKQCQTSATS